MHIYRAFALFITLIVGVFIFVYSSTPFPPSPSRVFSFLSVAYHVGVFFLLSSFLLLGVKADRNLWSKEFFLVFFLSLFYAFLDELHQHFVPGRAMDLMDVGYDVVGLFSGIMLMGFLHVVQARRN